MNRIDRNGNVKISEMILFAIFFAFCLTLFMESAALADTGGGTLPWEGAIKMVKDSITGPVAFGISLIAIVASGVALIFGGDMQGFMRTGAYLALVLGIIVAATKLLTGLYSDASAFIPFM